MVTRPVEPYLLVTPIGADLADDEDALTEYEQSLPEYWAERCRADGGTPIGTPTTERHPNPHYGAAMHTEDGHTYIDRTKLHLYTKGRAYR